MAFDAIAIIAVYFFMFFIHLGRVMARVTRPTAVIIIDMA